MNPRLVPRQQRGVITIFIAMVMLILVTLMVITAYSLSTINLQAVSNAQLREEAISAASIVIEETISADFTTNPAGVAVAGWPVDIDNDAVDDYFINLAVPVCVRFTQATVNSASSVTLPGMTSAGAFNTIWEISATATDANSGARVEVLHGVRVLLSATQKAAVCS